MSETDMQYGRHRLSAPQQSFIDSLFQAEAPARHLLIGPAGTGKGTTAVAAVAHIAATKPSGRVLFLCNRGLTRFIADRLSGICGGMSLLSVDRRRYRELEAAADHGKSPFNPSSVLLTSFATARHKDVSEGILATPWDLVVVDESDQLTESVQSLVRQLLLSGNAPRAMLMAVRPVVATIFSITATTDWTDSFAALVDRLGSVHVQPVRVAYTPGEQKVFQEAEQLVDDLRNGRMPSEASQISTHVGSSFFTLERSLRHLKNMAAPLTSLEPGSDGRAHYREEELEVEEGGAPVTWVHDRVVALLALMDEVGTDSKAEELAELVARLVVERPEACVMVVSRSYGTIEYLASVLSSRGIKVRSTSPRGETRTNDVIETVMSPGVSVMTLASLRGMDLSAVGTWVAYEKSPDLLRWVTMNRTGKANPPLTTDYFEFEAAKPVQETES